MSQQKESRKKDKKHSKTRVAKEEHKSDAEQFVGERMSRAQVKLDGVDNAQTFEHPASFQAQAGKLNAQSLKHFAENVNIDI